MSLRGLTILVASGDPERLHAALTYAAAGAAIGQSVRLHLHEMAVGLLRQSAPGDGARMAAGLPTLAQITDEALSMGVRISLCQSGLALNGMRLDELDSRIEAQGPVGLLNGLGEDRLAVF